MADLDAAELLALLGDESAELRTAAAVEIAERMHEVGFPDRRELFETFRRRDAEHPGVADAFWTKAVWGVPYDESFDRPDVERWICCSISR